MAFIRPYKSGDFEAAAHICRATLLPKAATSEPLYRLAPYIWTHQYTHLSPATCFVLDNGAGQAVGYCIGCPDVVAFAAAYPSYVTSVLEPSRDISAPSLVPNADHEKPQWLVDGEYDEEAVARTAHSAHWLLLHGNEDLMEAGYRATMHIDLLDEWQGKGWGRKLIDEFVRSVRDVEMCDGKESRGIWIGIGGSNAKVVPFYEKQGFRLRERDVKTEEIITMVRDY